MKNFVGVVGILALALLVGGCASQKSTSNVDLSGTWRLTMPSGFQHTAHISRQSADRYLMTKAGVIINGVYERRGNRLVMIQPADTELTSWVWRIDNGDHLTLVREPDVRRTRGGYQDSTLQR